MSITFAFQHFSILPRSLTSLRLIGEYDNESDLCPLSGRKLRKLRSSHSREDLLAIGRESLLFDQEQWKTEKQRLMTPRLIALGSTDYIKKVENGELFGIPVCLNELMITHPSSKGFGYLLPPHMAHTYIITEFDDSSAFNHLPPSDTLHVNLTLNGPQDTTIKDAKTQQQPLESALYLSNIKHLDVTFCSPVFASRSLQYLPRCLQTLKFNGPKYLHNHELKDLPSTLLSLTLDCPLANPLEPWVHLLPQTLTSLSVNAPILGTEIINLPPQLEHLSAPLFQVTLTQARQLPHCLRAIHVSKCDSRIRVLRDVFSTKALGKHFNNFVVLSGAFESLMNLTLLMNSN